MPRPRSNPSDAVGAAVRSWLDAHSDGALAIALSGGLDSSVLLHALARDSRARARGLRALHVDHGLHPESRTWARQCRALAAALGLPLKVLRVEVDVDLEGIEAGARRARYAAFAGALRRGEWLLTAQHADDQAETVLLKLMRGADLTGLAGMRRERPLGPGQLGRPLLDLARDALHAYAIQHGLNWILDPSNTDPRFERGWLRERVLPQLKDRWPAAVLAICRSAAHLDSERRRIETAVSDWLDAQLSDDLRSIRIEALMALDAPDRMRTLLAWIGRLGWRAPSQRQLETLLDQLADAPPAKQPALNWNQASLRRYRDRLYAVAGKPNLTSDWQQRWDLRQPLHLPDGSVLQVTGDRVPRRILSACARRGGERIRLPGRSHSTSVKHALQNLDLPPWQRAALPFLWDGDKLVAVGDVLVADGFGEWLSARGLELVSGFRALRA